MKRLYALLLAGCFLPIASKSFDPTEEKKARDIDFSLFASTNTVKGVPITPQNILNMLPKMAPTEYKFIQAWLEMRPDIAALMSGAEAFEGDNPPVTQGNEGRLAYYLETQARMKAAGINNLSKSSNAVFKLEQFILKAASLANRHKGIGTGRFGMKYGDQISPEQLKEFMAENNGNTYQTISRVAYLLRSKAARELFALDRIEFPEKYLVQIPGRPDTVADANYIVAEKQVKNIIADLQNHPLALDPEIIRQLTILIGYTALWNHVGSSGNIFVVKDPETGKLNINYHDTEQPNVHSPADFFHTKESVHFGNVDCGWNGIRDEIINAYATKIQVDIEKTGLSPEQKEFLKSLVAERVENLLQEKEKLQKNISAHFPQEMQQN